MIYAYDAKIKSNIAKNNNKLFLNQIFELIETSNGPTIPPKLENKSINEKPFSLNNLLDVLFKIDRIVGRIIDPAKPIKATDATIEIGLT